MGGLAGTKWKCISGGSCRILKTRNNYLKSIEGSFGASHLPGKEMVVKFELGGGWGRWMECEWKSVGC